MLHQLRGRIHQVYSGIAAVKEGKLYTDRCCTDVPMRDFSDEEIEAYIQSGDPMDKAGAYAIQHAGFHPVDDLQGCFANVMGLPLCHLSRTLRRFGYRLDVNVSEVCQNHIGYSCPVFSGILGD
jgi:predicted house-cleaning NTP pyrophosphatase (Maf/HAM1 superfamily)